MMSCKGFLVPDDERRPRITAKQARGVSKAVEAAITNAIDNAGLAVDLGALVRRVITEALDAYPVDRSCVTCDFLQGSTCAHWKQEVPSSAIGDGCDHHQEHGAPF
jgi:hypothetical protein